MKATSFLKNNNNNISFLFLNNAGWENFCKEMGMIVQIFDLMAKRMDHGWTTIE